MRHFKLLILLLGVFSLSSGFAQTTFDVDLQATLLKNMKKLKEGTEVHFTRFTHEKYVGPGFVGEQFFLIDDSVNFSFEIYQNLDDTFDFHYDDIQTLWDGEVISKVIGPLGKVGFQTDLREKMAEEVLTYVREIQKHGLEFEDPYLKSYIYDLAHKIMPKRLLDGRSPQINILLKQDRIPFGDVYPNGTIILSTGLLSVLHSEDELVAVLASELAHFVLDHGFQNIDITTRSAQDDDEFKISLLSILFGSEIIVTPVENSKVTISESSSEIRRKMLKYFGMAYDYRQKRVADRAALQILELLGYNKNALSTALNHIEELYFQECNNSLYAASEGYHSLDARIRQSGEPEKLDDVAFEQMVSFAVTNQAMMKYEDRRFKECVKFLDQNIENHVATADDYILKAKCLLVMSNTEESNREILDLLSEAKAIGRPLDADRIEIVVNLRMNRRTEAVALLKDYINKLSGMGGVSTDIYKAELLWRYNSEFVGQEIAWARKMLIKLHGMMGAEAPMPIVAAGV